MARFYTDENFPRPVIEFLRAMGHDVLTSQEAGNANLGIPDPEVLAFAASNDRAVLTGNRRHFMRLHFQQSDHAGIVVCTEDKDFEELASRIDRAVSKEENLRGKLIRLNRPSQ